ncbi:hypothetical protein EV426DRAFT_701088 [Tirmania nivea]|nr:hypothetical protein EV426DRAFT_701088 [Tirmania nivea]
MPLRLHRSYSSDHRLISESETLEKVAEYAQDSSQNKNSRSARSELWYKLENTKAAEAWIRINAYGIYLAYYLSHDLNPSATPYHYALIGGLSVSTSMTLGPVVAFLYRRGFTTQHIMLLGTALQLSSLPKASWALTSLPGLFLTQGVLFGLSIGFLFIPFNDHLQTTIDIAWSLRISAIIVSVSNLLATSLIRDRNQHINPTHRSFDIGLIKRVPNFALVLLWGFFSPLDTLPFSSPW